jgi:hypothetical protein
MGHCPRVQPQAAWVFNNWRPDYNARMAKNRSNQSRRTRPASRLQLFIALAVILAIDPLMIYWAFTRPGMKIFGIIAIIVPLFLIVVAISRIRAAGKNGRGP